jgi:photosystem II stability/assembly factor-like uncharacterized protein
MKWCGIAALIVAVSGAAWADVTVPESAYKGLEWRQIGPFRGGRSLAVAGSVQRPDEYYFGATGGGVWKTSDAGKTWRPVSDGFFRTASVGALAVAPSNPDIVVAGTGERDIRGNISHGDGVYRSDDAGKTWRHLGLKDAQSIARIAIHPQNPDVMYVAALGHIYAHPKVKENPNRGLYKTTDGGKTWTNILKGGDRVGAVHVVLDPKQPDTLLCALWEAWRSPYSMNSGGPGSRLMKSTDGGRSWTDLSARPGMPSGPLGKIGFDISPADPNRYYACVEAAEGGIFRSDDAGATWERVNSDRNWRQRAWYYSHVYADPKQKDGVYVLNVGAGKSTDGGKRFAGMRTPHSDNHDLWIAPDNPNRMINANDGGGNVSVDGGKTWTEQTYPTAQFYHVSTDNAFPYRILGAQQDNSTVRIASRTTGLGIGADDWTSTAGGESGYVAAKPNQPDLVFGGSYGGTMDWYDHRTGLSGSIDPWPDNPMGHGAADLVQRFQWTYPIVFSPHDPNVLYTCSQFVLRSTDNGQSWRKISPDLSRNDRSTMGPSGGPITKDNTSVEYYGTVFTLAESSKRRGLLWAGSDDGLIHVSDNGGGTWRNVTPKAMPEWGLVSMIEASPHRANVAYAAVDNHENDDLRPYIYRTEDFGKTWTSITRGLPNDTFVRVVREDHRVPGLLYAGTETGVFVSFDHGAKWQPLAQNMPVTPIHDLAWKEDDLVAATHGRAFWVLDDLSPLQQLARDAKLDAPRLFTPRDAYRVRWGSAGTNATGKNPGSGVGVTYYLPAEAKDLKIEFAWPDGKVFQTVTGPKQAGLQRVYAFLQEPSWKSVPGMILWAAGPSPITLPPGEYTVRLTVDGTSQTSKFRWKRDPRLMASDADLVQQYRFAREIAMMTDAIHTNILQIRHMRGQLDTAHASAEKKGDTALAARITAYRQRLVALEEALYQTKNQSGQDPLNYPIRLNNRVAALMNTVLGNPNRPTAGSREVFAMLQREYADVRKGLTLATGAELEAVNAALRAAALPAVNTVLPDGK